MWILQLCSFFSKLFWLLGVPINSTWIWVNFSISAIFIIILMNMFLNLDLITLTKINYVTEEWFLFNVINLAGYFFLFVCFFKAWLTQLMFYKWQMVLIIKICSNNISESSLSLHSPIGSGFLRPSGFPVEYHQVCGWLYLSCNLALVIDLSVPRL